MNDLTLNRFATTKFGFMENDMTVEKMIPNEKKSSIHTWWGTEIDMFI